MVLIKFKVEINKFKMAICKVKWSIHKRNIRLISKIKSKSKYIIFKIYSEALLSLFMNAYTSSESIVRIEFELSLLKLVLITNHTFSIRSNWGLKEHMHTK